jgi:hypothetical protein
MLTPKKDEAKKPQDEPVKVDMLGNPVESYGELGFSPIPLSETPETVEVSKDKLDSVLERMDKLEEDNKAKDKEIEILRDSVSRGRLEEAEDKRKEKEQPRAYLKVFMGKVVIGWKSLPQKIVYNPTTGLPVGEVLQATYKFIDGTDSGLVDQVDFTRTEEREHVRILEKVDNEVVRIQFENPSLPQSFDINQVFLNP